MMKVHRDAGGPLSDSDVILAVARTVLAGPKDEGRASYQVHIHQCPDCGRAEQEGRGELISVGPEVLEKARCDAQEVQVSASAERPSSAPAPARREQSSPAAVLIRRSADLDLEPTRPFTHPGRPLGLVIPPTLVPACLRQLRPARPRSQAPASRSAHDWSDEPVASETPPKPAEPCERCTAPAGGERGPTTAAR